MSSGCLYRTALCAGLLVGLCCPARMLDAAQETQQHIRQPAVADAFYPAEPAQLRSLLDTLLEQAPAHTVAGELMALVVPHAGYVFSGGVAATGYRLLQGQTYDVVIVVGVSHQVPVRDAVLHPPGAFVTPLGAVPIAADALTWLTTQSSVFSVARRPHAREHSIEVQLPFLQRTLGRFTLVPIVLGTPSIEVCQRVGAAIAGLVAYYAQEGRRCLLIASSDFSHYPAAADAHTVDHHVLEAVRSGEVREVEQVSSMLMRRGIPRLFTTMCGAGAVKTVMAAARILEATAIQQLDYATSADVAQGDAERVVGYATLTFARPAGVDARASSSMPIPAWHGEERRMWQLAWDALEGFVTDGEEPDAEVQPLWSASLKAPAAVFVTLRKDGHLRGCIGTTEARLPLGVAVQQYAIAAARNDQRFHPVTDDELEGLSLEISVLSPLQRITDPAVIQPDVHGVVLRQGRHSGLFLPHVWGETHWNTETFLRELSSQKAHLGPDAWKDPTTELYIFTVHTFTQ